ncbi:MAG: aliphatic sulfonates ABC transporter substrate-binding protein, partial [Pseudolysinimonas sp.]
NSYGFLNATEQFLAASPDLAQLVVNAYERARAWALENPEETAAILAEVAGIDPAIASAVLIDRTNLDLDGIPGETQYAVLEIIAPVLVEIGSVQTQQQVDDALESLLDPQFAEKADPDFFA